MPLYRYTAINPDGETIKGNLNAINEVDLEDRLKVLGLDVLQASEMKQRFGKRKIDPKDLILLCIQFEQLDRAGVPILQAIADMRDTADNSTIRNIMAEVYEDIKGGKLLSAALAKHPNSFDSVFTSIVSAGERTGSLSKAFGHLVTHLKWTSEIRRQIIKSLMFPIGMLVVLTIVITVMMTLVIPKLIKFMLAQSIDLPWYTTWLISTSHAFVDYWYIIFGIPACLITALVMLVKSSEKLAYYMDGLKLHLPMIGETIRKIELARFCRFFGLTFNSGLGILECLAVAHNAIQNRVIRTHIIKVQQEVSEGSRLTASLQASGQFPSLVIRMFKVGEDSGKFEEVLENVNFFYDKEVADSIELMIGSIRPSLTLVMGVILFWIIAAVFGPIYGSFSKLKI